MLPPIKSKYWQFDLALKEVGIPYIKEYQFAKKHGRKWQSDYFFIGKNTKLAVEIEGGAYINGRHTRSSGFIKDMQKYNCYQLLDIRLLRFTPEQIVRNPFNIANLIKNILLNNLLINDKYKFINEYLK